MIQNSLCHSKINDCYKQIVALKKNSYTENDVMVNEYVIWNDNEKKDFTLEHVWWLLKDQPRWLEQCKKVSSKRTKINEN